MELLKITGTQRKLASKEGKDENRHVQLLTNVFHILNAYSS